MAVIPRNAQGHGWLRPAIGVVELSQCIIQVMNLIRIFHMQLSPDMFSFEKSLFTFAEFSHNTEYFGIVFILFFIVICL